MIPQLKDRYYELRSAELSENKNLIENNILKNMSSTTISSKIDDLVDRYNRNGLDKWRLSNAIRLYATSYSR